MGDQKCDASEIVGPSPRYFFVGFRNTVLADVRPYSKRLEAHLYNQASGTLK